MLEEVWLSVGVVGLSMLPAQIVGVGRCVTQEVLPQMECSKGEETT